VGIDLREQEYWNGVERQTAPDSQYISDNFDKRRALLHELTKYEFTNASILEIGTGNGITAHLVRSINVPMNYKGLDVSDKFAATAKRLLKLDVTVGDASELPWPDNSFDAFWAFDCLEHIAPHKREKLFLEIRRVLRPNGLIFINNPLDEHTTGHDKDFDFGFTETDVARLCEITGTHIFELKTIESHKRQYQFIVLSPLTGKPV
jgi:ubiquinone/menaquinone biosynthesis C-methylase UbiE